MREQIGVLCPGCIFVVQPKFVMQEPLRIHARSESVIINMGNGSVIKKMQQNIHEMIITDHNVFSTNIIDLKPL